MIGIPHKRIQNRLAKRDDETLANWKILLALTVVCAYLYVFSEWLFFATKPSFLSSLEGSQKISVFLVSSLPLALASLILLCFLWLCTLPLPVGLSKRLVPAVARVVPSLIVATLLFLMIDNFSYTVFVIGVGTADPQWSWLYFVLFGALVILAYRKVRKLQFSPASRKFAPKLLICALLLLSVSFTVALVEFKENHIRSLELGYSAASEKPNILLVSGDGLNAENMAVYGYQRNNTPFLSRLAQESLLCRNAFSNSAHTGASVASLLTGKLPTETRLIYPPDILKGEDAYQHLPAILKGLAYRNGQFSIRHYADPFDLNMRHSFDWANSGEFQEYLLSERLTYLIGQINAYFQEKMRSRVRDRIFQLMGWGEMGDAFEEVVQQESKLVLRDRERLDDLFAFIEMGGGPFFAHLHLMGTHGPRFSPKRQVFSDSADEQRPWMTDFYDDAILDFDYYVKEVIEFLKQRGILENTVVVVFSDHGQQFQTTERIPFLIRFPEGGKRGQIQENVELIDLVPTLLEYLGMERPDWMTGESILAGDLNPYRPIFSAGRHFGLEREKGILWEMDLDKIGPPFFSLGEVAVVICDKWYRLNLTENQFLASQVPGHTAPCEPDRLPSNQEVRELILQHLRENGYDTSSISD